MWDDDGRLVDVIDSGVNQHSTYDAGGLRVRRKATQSDTIFSSPYFDLENGTQGVKHVFAGDLRVASKLGKFAGGEHPVADTKAGTAYFFHPDHLGSTTVVTAQDGSVFQSLEYFVDGETWIDRAPQKPVNGYLFNGKPMDPATGFYDFGQRFYDPRTSQWLGPDSALVENPSLTAKAPGMLAGPTFAMHSPASRIDPDGRCPFCFAVVFALVAMEQTEGEPELSSWELLKRASMGAAGGMIVAGAPEAGAAVTERLIARGTPEVIAYAVGGATAGVVTTAGFDVAQRRFSGPGAYVRGGIVGAAFGVGTHGVRRALGALAKPTSGPTSAASSPGSGAPEGARRELADELTDIAGRANSRRPAVVIGAQSTETGEAVAGRSSAGPTGCCAEVDAAGKLGGDPKAIQFTMPVRPRTGGIRDVCKNCQKIFDRSQFPPGTPFE